MLKMCLSGCSFCVLLWHSILFPEDAKYRMQGIIPFNKCVCDFYQIQAVCSVFVDMKDHQMVQSAVRSGRTEVRFYLLHGRKWSLADCISSKHDKDNFCQHNDLGHVFVVALNDCTNSTSFFALSIVDSGKYLRVSSCVFNSSPLKSSLHNWRTWPKSSAKSFPRRERKKNSCIFLNTIQSVCSNWSLNGVVQWVKINWPVHVFWRLWEVVCPNCTKKKAGWVFLLAT